MDRLEELRSRFNREVSNLKSSSHYDIGNGTSGSNQPNTVPPSYYNQSKPLNKQYQSPLSDGRYNDGNNHVDERYKYQNMSKFDGSRNQEPYLPSARSSSYRPDDSPYGEDRTNSSTRYGPNDSYHRYSIENQKRTPTHQALQPRSTYSQGYQSDASEPLLIKGNVSRHDRNGYDLSRQVNEGVGSTDYQIDGRINTGRKYTDFLSSNDSYRQRTLPGGHGGREGYDGEQYGSRNREEFGRRRDKNNSLESNQSTNGISGAHDKDRMKEDYQPFFFSKQQQQLERGSNASVISNYSNILPSIQEQQQQQQEQQLKLQQQQQQIQQQEQQQQQQQQSQHHETSHQHQQHPYLSSPNSHFSNSLLQPLPQRAPSYFGVPLIQQYLPQNSPPHSGILTPQYVPQNNPKYSPSYIPSEYPSNVIEPNQYTADQQLPLQLQFHQEQQQQQQQQYQLEQKIEEQKKKQEQLKQQQQELIFQQLQKETDNLKKENTKILSSLTVIKSKNGDNGLSDRSDNGNELNYGDGSNAENYRNGVNSVNGFNYGFRGVRDDGRSDCTPRSPISQNSSIYSNNNSNIGKRRILAERYDNKPDFRIVENNRNFDFDPFNDDVLGNYSPHKNEIMNRNMSSDINMSNDKDILKQRKILNSISLNHETEMKTIQYEMIRLKEQKKLDEYKCIIEKEKTLKTSDLEHINFLRNQKEQLEGLKLKQIAARDRTLFKKFVLENVPESIPSQFLKENEEDERFKKYISTKNSNNMEIRRMKREKEVEKEDKKAVEDHKRKFDYNFCNNHDNNNHNNYNYNDSVTTNSNSNQSSTTVTSRDKYDNYYSSDSNDKNNVGNKNKIQNLSYNNSFQLSSHATHSTSFSASINTSSPLESILANSGVGSEFHPLEDSQGITVLVDGLLITGVRFITLCQYLLTQKIE